MSKADYKHVEEKMDKCIAAFKEVLASIRAGRANPAVLDKIYVDYYGTPTNITKVGNVSVADARTIVIQPWESKLLKEIEKAIQKSDLGINPANDGKVIRLNFPALTEERRKELTKHVKKEGEEAKIHVRNVRRDVMEEYKAQKKKSEITEDDLKDAEKEVQKITDNYIAEVEKIVALKDKEILEV